MKKIILLLPFLMLSFFCKAQTTYKEWIQKADSLQKAKQYREAGMTYVKAFQANGWRGYMNDRYNAACAWAQCNEKDSAFLQLTKIIEKLKYRKYAEISNEKDFKNLHQDERWKTILEKVKKNQDEYENYSNKPLRMLIDSIRYVDQLWRNRSITKRNGDTKDDLTTEQLSAKVKQTDSLNYFIAKKIFSEYGFPNSDIIGMEGTQNFWLIVQHQDRHPKFQDSVLTSMKVAVDAGKASKEDYALLIDRVKLNTGGQQIYGTQTWLGDDSTTFVMRPCIEPEKVNERRKEMGMESIEDYIQRINKMYRGELKKKR